MKRTIITFNTLLLFVMTTMAQETVNSYNSFVTEGKIWVCQGYQALSPHTGMDRFETLYFFQGDSVVDGVTYKCMYRKKSFTGGYKQTELIYLLKQDGDKVYTQKGDVLYEFGLKVGDTSINGWQVISVGDTILNDHIKRKYLKVSYKNTIDSMGAAYASDIWVEGLGSLETGIEKDFDLHLSGSISYTLQKVAQNGKYVYNQKDKEVFRAESIIAENKLWHCKKNQMNTQEVQDKYYYMQGDTLILGKTAKKMHVRYSEKSNTGDYCAALYEDGERVYYCYAGQKEFTLLYDFSLNIGEQIIIDGALHKVIGKDYISVNDKNLRRVHLASATDYEESTNIWIEGFGSLINPIYASVPVPGTYESFHTCKMDGETVLDSEDINIPSLYPSWVGAIWSYTEYDGKEYGFVRYTVLDEPKTIEDKIYFPLVQYSSCEYTPKEEEGRWYIRQEDNFVYILKIVNSDYPDSSEGIYLYEREGDHILYDFNYSPKKDFCIYVGPTYSYETISMQDTTTIYVEGGQRHRAILVGENNKWIDGIGSTRSLIHPITTKLTNEPYGTELNYFRSADGKTVYFNPIIGSNIHGFKIDDCSLIYEELPPVLSVTSAQRDDICISSVSQTLLCTSPTAVKLEVYTMDAVKVGEAAFASGEATVKVKKTPATYLYIVTYPDGRRESGKVVVKD